MANIIDDEMLDQVTGGAKLTFEQKKKAFELAWDTLMMEAKGFSGNRKAELFEEWDSESGKKTASDFLTQFKG